AMTSATAGGSAPPVLTAACALQLLLRQYVIKLKKSGTRMPRVELREMGPRLDLALRRTRTAAPDVQKEALVQPRLGKRKEKNVASDNIEGKVGRMYMPKQKVDSMALAKPKGTKRERRSAASERKMKRQKPAAPAMNA
ncbi:hypothetical protein QJQ45_009669, partial [Haematococcus lacustris]